MKQLGLELIFILGVPSRFRGENLVSIFKPYKVSCKVIPGIDSKSLSPVQSEILFNQKAAKIVLGRQITLGEVCCSMVHLEAYKNFLQTSTEWVLILEDDAVMVRDVEEMLSSLITLNSPTILKLSDSVVEGSINKSINSENIRVSALGFRKLKFPTSMAHAYLINREAATIAIEMCKGMKIHFTADWPYLWDNRVDFWQSNNPYFKQQGESLIDAGDERLAIISYGSSRRGFLKKITENLLDFSGLNSLVLTLYGGNGVEYFKSKPLRKFRTWIFRARNLW